MKSIGFFTVSSLLVSLASAAPAPINLFPNTNSQSWGSGLLSGFKNFGGVLASAIPRSNAVTQSAPTWRQAASRGGSVRATPWLPLRACGKPHQPCTGNAYVYDYNMKGTGETTACDWRNFNGKNIKVVALPLRYMGPRSTDNDLCGASVTITLGEKVVVAPVGDKRGSLRNGNPQNEPPGSEHDIAISPAIAEDLDLADANSLRGIKWTINTNEKVKKVTSDQVAGAGRVNVPPSDAQRLNTDPTKPAPANRQVPNFGSTEPVTPKVQRPANRETSNRKVTSPGDSQTGATAPAPGNRVTGSSMSGATGADSLDTTGSATGNTGAGAVKSSGRAATQDSINAKPGQTSITFPSGKKTTPGGNPGPRSETERMSGAERKEAIRQQRPSTAIAEEPPTNNRFLPASDRGAVRIPYPNLENDTPWDESSAAKNKLQLANIPAALNKAPGRASSSWLDDLVRSAK